jgi:hypothetical protein
MTVAGLRSMSRFAFTVSFRKSYSSSIGYSSSVHRRFRSCEKQVSLCYGIEPSITDVNLLVVNFERVDVLVILLDLV